MNPGVLYKYMLPLNEKIDDSAMLAPPLLVAGEEKNGIYIYFFFVVVLFYFKAEYEYEFRKFFFRETVEMIKSRFFLVKSRCFEKNAFSNFPMDKS